MQRMEALVLIPEAHPARSELYQHLVDDVSVHACCWLHACCDLAYVLSATLASCPFGEEKRDEITAVVVGMIGEWANDPDAKFGPRH